VASENKIKTKMSSKKYSGVYCCVVGCNSAYPRDKEKVQFFCFSKKNLEQRKLWVKAINRVNEDGTNWIPKVYTRVCSLHFVTGKPSPTQNHPDYSPSIFPTSHKTKRSQLDCKRLERLLKRSKQRHDGPTGKMLLSNFL
jgi:hypothetical protein